MKDIFEIENNWKIEEEEMKDSIFPADHEPIIPPRHRDCSDARTALFLPALDQQRHR
jgi:hypothetical protein